ncbi:MAG: LLM class flavin-dependent oxidoreductase [Streptosporangiales bacterium]
MTDYGHELRFGAFITPTNQQPESVLALTRLAEQTGLDLATFQDHPYQPAYLDTWTLLAYLAGQTERIGLAGNVLNLPLRQPAVLARSAASLDILSGGRVELALGAGAFWDAIAAMGGPRRDPGAAVEALAEAIQVIRGIWDTGERGVLRVDGRHYQVAGAKRGPAPAHRIGVWLGVYGPRMLRLVGRTADGWLPSLAYLRPGQLARGNEAIDDAARAAGRDPAACGGCSTSRAGSARATRGTCPGRPSSGPTSSARSPWRTGSTRSSWAATIPTPSRCSGRALPPPYASGSPPLGRAAGPLPYPPDGGRSTSASTSHRRRTMASGSPGAGSGPSTIGRTARSRKPTSPTPRAAGRSASTWSTSTMRSAASSPSFATS